MSNDDPNQINLDRNNTVQKRGSILRPDLHRQISELLDQNYNLSPDRILVNIDRINFENYDKVDNQNNKSSDKFSNTKLNMNQSQDIIPLNVKNKKVTYYSDSQSQTDLSFNDIKIKGDINPVLAEVEILGFFYMTEKERMEQLKLLLSDNYDNYKTAFDPCLEFEQYSRETEPTSGKYNVRNRSSSRLKSAQKDDTKFSIACQTFFVSPPAFPKPDIHKSTQTINENSSPSDSNQSSPSHNLVTATTKTVIKKDPEQENESKIKEKFSIKNKKDDSLEYVQFSEYQTVGNKTEKLNSFLKVTESEKVIDGKKLVHSTIEMTSVIENKTTVTGISVKDAPEKFCIQTITPKETKQDTKPQENLLQLDNIPDKESKFEVISDLVFQTNIPKKKEVAFNIPKEPLVDLKFVPNKPPIDQVKISSPKVTKTETKFPKDQVLNSPSPKPVRIDPESILNKDYKRNIYELNDKREKPKSSVTEYKDDELLSNEDSFNSPTSSTLSKPSINEYTINQIPKVIGINSNFKSDFRSPISTPDFNSPGQTKKLSSNDLNINLTSSDMGLNKKDAKTGGQNTISQLPGMFKFDNNRNLPAAKATSPKVLPANKKETIDNSNQFSIHQIPKMFKYEATVEQIKTKPDVNLQLSDSLKKRLDQNEMVMMGESPRNSNLKQIKPISVSTNELSTTKPKTVSFKEKLIQQKALKSIDVNENNDIIEVDFDSYEAPTIRQVIKEIEVPVELPRNRGASVDNLSFEKRVSFRTDPIGQFSTKPVVKERSRKEFLLNYPYQNLEIDFNAYENEINQRYQSPSKAKISENSTNSDSKIDVKIEETKDNKKSEIEARMNSLSTENILNETTKPILRVSSQIPFKSNLNSKKGLSVSFEKLLISENSSDNGVFEISGISCLNEKSQDVPNVYNQTINFNTKSKPLTKMEELIISNIEREYQKAVHRAKQRKERVPEILKLLDQSSGKEMKNLQEELKFLMRKSRIDNELIKQYSFLDSNESFSDSTDLKVKSKKKRRSQSNYTGLENETDLESTSLTSFNNKFLKNKNTKLISKKLNKNDYFKSSNKTLESGYSSLEDSFNDLKSDLENGKKKLTPKVNKINNENIGDLKSERVEPKLNLEVSVNDNENDVDKQNPSNPHNKKSKDGSSDQKKNINNSTNNIISSNKISGRSVPINQTTEQGSSYKSSGSNNQSVAPENRSSSNQASPQNNNQNNSNNKNDEDDDDDERRKKKNILDNRRNVNYQEPDRIEMNYIEEDELDNLDLENYDIYQNPETGESLLIDLRTKESFVILPRNWRESENSFYFAEEDLDLNSLEINVDERTNRRYIFDEQTLRPYFIVKSISIKKLSKNLGQKMDQSQIIKDSAQVIQMKHSDESNDSGIETDYVEEKELDNLNLADFDFKVDETSGETVIISRSNANLRWIIIPDDWRTIENLPYVSEEDISLVQIDIYTDPKSKRKYVIDEQSGQRYYIVPKFRKDIRNFISSRPLDFNTKLTTKDKPSGQSPSDILKSSLKNKPDQTKPNQDNNNLKREKSSIMLGDERVENLENEPSNLKLRESEAKSPARKTRFDPNLPLSFKNYNLYENQNKLIIKQPGKPGHLINNNNNNNNINNNRPFTNNTNNMNNINQPKDKKQKPPKTKKQIDKEQAKKIALAKMKYEASRQAFFQQKLPDVGKLWLHQLLIEQNNQKKRMDNLIKGYNSTKNLNTDDIDPNAYLDQYGKPKAWRSLNQLTDPTVDSNGQSLDRDRLLDIKIYGYDRFDKSKRKRNIFDEDENKHKHGKDYEPSLDPNNSSFGGFRDYDYIRAVLSEDFVESKEYRPMQLNRYYRALVPHTKLNLRQQFLTTPRYLKPTWEDVLKQSDKMQPKIILINDNELILTKNRNCNIYVQYEYKNDAVMGANQLYQLMLPDRGPTNPARPLMISPAKLSKVNEMKQKTRPELALRDAPVFVYHQDGNAFYENLAQYLAGNQAKLSPKTARKILQFSDLKEFEDYLSSKITRNEAKRLAEMSGEDIINIDSIQRDLLNIIKDKKETNGDPSYYHMNCQYDSLRPKGEEDNETREYEVSGTIMKSTFIGFGNDGEPKRVRFNELPQNVMNIMREASIQDSKK